MGPHKKGLKKDYIISAVEASLKRLQTDRIDLYISHHDDEDTPLEETLEIYGHLIMHGKIRVPGASNFSAKRLGKALEISHKTSFPAYQSLQPQYNLYDRQDFEMHLLPLCQEAELGVTPYFSLASGFLTGKYRSEEDFKKSTRGTRMNKYLDERGLKILAGLDQVAKETKASVASVSLAWLMAQPTITAPIASATSPEQLKDLVAAADLKLSPAQIENLNTASAY
jgi:aryl-alcohol dehydrogenase-like predicted oxidoreductase